MIGVRLAAPRIFCWIVIMSKKLRVPILLFLLLIVILLFLAGFLTGQVHHEFENPFSRTRKIVETKYGFTRDNVISSSDMETIYYEQLKQPRKDKWVRRQDGYTIGRFSWTKIFETGEIAPVTLLDAKVEADFLQYIPNTQKVRLAVINSLYSERKTGTDLESIDQNARLLNVESDRVRTIIHWNEYVRGDTTIMRAQWWKENAKRFGINPDGSPFTQTDVVDSVSKLRKKE